MDNTPDVTTWQVHYLDYRKGEERVVEVQAEDYDDAFYQAKQEYYFLGLISCEEIG